MRIATETVYVRLLDEGTNVIRPTQAEPTGDGVYRLLPTSDYDPDDEIWEFAPGATVTCRRETWSEGAVLVAHELVDGE